MATITGSLSNDEYRKVKAYSKSDLDLIHRSPALLDWAKNCPSDGSPAVDRGTDLHCALLEPSEFTARYVRMPEYDLRSSAGRANAEAFRESMSGSGRIIQTATEHDMVIAMRDSVLAHPVARSLLTVSGRSEQSIFWELEGMRLKCRPDRIPDEHHFGHVLVDVKKIADADKMQSHFQHFRYHVQNSFYSDAYQQLTGSMPRFIFVCVGERRSIGRHPVHVVELPLEWVELGRDEYRADLAIAKELDEFGSSFDVELLPMPKWLNK